MDLNSEIQGLIELLSNVLDAHTAALFTVQNGQPKLTLKAYYTLSHFVLPGAGIEFGSGILGWVAREGEPVNYSNFEHDPKTLQYYAQEENIKSFMAVPVNYGEQLLGVLCVDSKRSHMFNPKQQKILSGFAGQLSHMLLRQDEVVFALSSSAGYNKLLALAEGFTSLDTVTPGADARGTLFIPGQIGGGQAPALRVADAAYRASCKILDFESCLLALVKPSGVKVQLELAYGYSLPKPDELLDPKIGLCRVIWQKRSPLLLNDLNGQPDSLAVMDNLYPQTQVKSFLGLPLLFAGEMLGVLAYTSDREEAYSQRDLQLAGILAWQLATYTYRSISKIKQDNIIDKDNLTQTLTYTAFQSKLEQALKNSSRYRPLSVLRLEVANLTSINAEHGYQAGDNLLGKLAKILMDMDSCDVGRIGGNQFGVFLADTDQEQARQLVKRIYQILNRVKFEFGGNPLDCKVNVGLACYPKDTNDRLKLWEMATPISEG